MSLCLWEGPCEYKRVLKRGEEGGRGEWGGEEEREKEKEEKEKEERKEEQEEEKTSTRLQIQK